VRRLRVFTWHIHGSYLWYLSHVPHDIFVPLRADPRGGYGGRAGSFPWPANLHEVPADQVRDLELDCVLFQSRQAYVEDQFQILSAAQRNLPHVYLEHDPPREHPTDTRHIVDDPNVLLIHVTSFNQLMWDSGRTPTRVIRHGVRIPESVHYSGRLSRGIVVVNHLAHRGRRLGADVFEQARQVVPLDLIGMASAACGGLGEIQPPNVPEFIADYRFFFNPIRYTSLGLAVCEAMMVGLPIVALATTELADTIQHGYSGYLSTDPAALNAPMLGLLNDLPLARRMGLAAHAFAREHFAIQRFVAEWNSALADVVGSRERVFAVGAAH
jgi:glycosyltransferase involved in cell wall biosynthesis